jgi:hypothetical protein
MNQNHFNSFHFRSSHTQIPSCERDQQTSQYETRSWLIRLLCDALKTFISDLNSRTNFNQFPELACSFQHLRFHSKMDCFQPLLVFSFRIFPMVQDIYSHAVQVYIKPKKKKKRKKSILPNPLLFHSSVHLAPTNHNITRTSHKTLIIKLNCYHGHDRRVVNIIMCMW